MTEEEKSGVASPDTGVDVQDDVEKRARAQGWKDRDEFDSSRTDRDFVDAKTFLENAEKANPVLKERIRKMGDELTASRLEIAEMKKAVVALKDFHQKNLVAEREKTIRQLQAKQEAAVENGDVQEFRKVTAEIDAEVKAINDAAPQQQAQPAPPPEVVAFLERHRVALANQEIAEDVFLEAGKLNRHGIFGKSLIDAVEHKMAKLYPEYFRAPVATDDGADEADDQPPRRKTGVPPLEQGRGVSRGTQTTKKERGFDDLTDEGKAACALLIRRGIMKDRKEYVSGLPQDDPEIWRR